MILDRFKLRLGLCLCWTLCSAGSVTAQEETPLRRALPQVSLGLPLATPAKQPSPPRELNRPGEAAVDLSELALPPDLLLEAADAPATAELPNAPPLPPPPPASIHGSRRSTVKSLAPPPAPSSTLNALDALPPAVLEPVPPPTAPAAESLPAPASQQAQMPNEQHGETIKNRFELPPGKEEPQPTGPTFFAAAGAPPLPAVDPRAQIAPYDAGAFSAQPWNYSGIDPYVELSPYRGKSPVAVQRPLLELGRPLYTGGIYPPAQTWLGRHNLVMPHFMVYGDYRSGIGINRNAQGDTNNWAQRLNLDMDLEITATERLHAFMGPLDRAGDFTRLDFTDDVDFINRADMRLDNLFFEGDAGAIWGGLTGQYAPFDLPFSFGLMPIFYQNGVWAADNVLGAAVALPSQNSPLLKWSNYDATFFWASDQINTDAFPGDNNAAEFFGTAWFIEAYDGYIEADYAFVHDDVGQHRSYHNLSVAYTRRYFYRVSNAVRYIVNFGQSLPSDERTADGHMLLIENSLISKAPNTLVPYLNFFYGQGRTQSLARANVAGGILNNTGINFEIDGLTGYPTLDATGVNASGAALGVNILGADFQHQLILEVAALAANGQRQLRNAPGDQYAVGMRYQKPLSNAWIFRTDHMLGYREDARDLRGSRIELRWKF